jgi:hypothetical protein
MNATEKAAPMVFKRRTHGTRLALFDFSEAAKPVGQ